MLLPSGHATSNDHQQPPLSLSNGCAVVGSTISTAQTTATPSIITTTTTTNICTANASINVSTALTTISNVVPITTTITTTTTTTTANATTNTCNNWDINRHLDVLQDSLKDGWTIHLGKEGRLYYCNHLTRTAGWLPPCENWGSNEELPYGWEKALDNKGRSYFINHLNKTSTYEAPDYSRWNDETPPEPRIAILQRSTTMGFGFVAGSERPVIVRFVTEGGPSVNKLQPGDQILAVNGEDVKEAPRDHVIQLVRSCDTQVTLLVCQPVRNSAGPGRKSTILSAGKRAKLRTRPSRVRFAESVCVNGAPLFPPSAFSLGDLCVPPMANVLKVFLENGQTKSFKYDATTTVQDVVTSLNDKLCLNASEHFSLVLEHVKSLKRNKLTLLDSEETLARIAARPGAHKLRCLFRVTFVPVSAAELAQKDLNALDYLYMQCCNDVTQERFAPELQPDVALRLAALHMHQHALANNVSPAKLTVKIVEREFGLERFVPSSLMEGMKRKELRRLIAHFLKLNSQMTGSSTKMLTQLQAKIHYLDIISGLPSYGAKCFSTNQREGVERVLLISPRFGLSQIAGVRNSVPQPISTLEEIIRVIVHREDDITCSVHVQMDNDRIIKFSMEDRDACEFSLVLAGYHKLLTGKELPVDREREKYDDDNAPAYLSQHTVFPTNWNYLPTFHNRAHSINFLVPPIYHSLQEISVAKGEGGIVNLCDRNMNTTLPNNNNNHNHNNNHKGYNNMDNIHRECEIIVDHHQQDEYGLDLHSVMAMELLEEAAKDCGGSSSSGCSSTSGPTISICEAKNEEVLRRVAEMQKMVESSEQYLNEHGELIHEYEIKSNLRQPWNSTSIELDSDCESLNSSKVSSNEDAPPPGALKHSDSLVLLAEAINQDLTGITQGLNSINNSNNSSVGQIQKIINGCTNSSILTDESIGGLNSKQSTPKPVRKINGLSQLLSDLQALGNDCSQSESDSESVHTPSTSPIHPKRNVSFSIQQNGHKAKINSIRTSFGLHSPDNGILGNDTKDNNLREYLRQLKEFSKIDTTSTIKTINNDDDDDNNLHNNDMTAKKLSELYGFEIGEDTLIETDADLIDLRALPPPQTPDELDAFTILNAAPRGFGDTNIKSDDELGDLDKFLAKVIVAPPTQKATPAKELTPEEIMSFIIPPPPNLDELEKHRKNIELNIIKKKNSQVVSDKLINNSSYNNKYSKESLYSNSSNMMILNQNNNCNNNNNNSSSSCSSSSSSSNSNHRINTVPSVNEINNGKGPTTKQINQQQQQQHIIEYPTVERKGAFSCCTKSKRDDESPINSESSDNNELILPPRRCIHNNDSSLSPPARPPKSADLQQKLISSPAKRITFSSDLKKIESYSINQNNPPVLPPRSDDFYSITTTTTASSSSSFGNNNSQNNSMPPKKPPLPPISMKPILRNPQPLPKPNINSPMKVAGIGSPHLHRNLNIYRDIDKAFTTSSSSSNTTSPTQNISTNLSSSPPQPLFPIPHPRSNGHYRSNSDCPPVCLKNPNPENKPQLSLLCSPQMSRKVQINPSMISCTTAGGSVGNSIGIGKRFEQQIQQHQFQQQQQQYSPPIIRNGYVINGESLLAKTDVAMAGLLVKLDQVAAQCTAAQSAGGGSNIDEEKFQKARDELTEQTLSLVTASKLLVVSMSDTTLSSLPEHLTSSLTAIRRITELTQDMTRHTSSPLQTRNIVLKVHDVASSFRELAGVQIGLLGAGQLALQAECLAGVLTTLLRSLRVFSP